VRSLFASISIYFGRDDTRFRECMLQSSTISVIARNEAISIVIPAHAGIQSYPGRVDIPVRRPYVIARYEAIICVIPIVVSISINITIVIPVQTGIQTTIGSLFT